MSRGEKRRKNSTLGCFGICQELGYGMEDMRLGTFYGMKGLARSHFQSVVHFLHQYQNVVKLRDVTNPG